MKIEVTFSTGEKETFKTDNKSFIVGRSQSADNIINDEGVSREHMKVDIDGDKIQLTDLNSTNGVFINEERIPANEPTDYNTFFALRVSFSTVLMFVFEDEVEEVTPVSELMKYKIPDAPKPMARSEVKSELSKKRAKKEEKTTVIKLNPKTGKKEVKKKSSDSWLPILLVLGFCYYAYTNYFKDDASQTVKTAEMSKVAAPVIEEKKLEEPVKALDEFEYKRILKEGLCKSEYEKELCLLLGEKKLSHEGFIVNGDSILLFVDIKHRLAVANSEPNPEVKGGVKKDAFSKFTVMEQYEFLLTYQMLQAELLESAKKKSEIKSIHGIGYWVDYEIPSILIIATMNLNKVKNFKKLDHSHIFSSVFTKGDLRAYNKYFKPTYEIAK